MDIHVQHDFTLARLWAWMKVELFEKASSESEVDSKEPSESAVSGTDQHELKVGRRFSHAEEEVCSTVHSDNAHANISRPMTQVVKLGQKRLLCRLQ